LRQVDRFIAPSRFLRDRFVAGPFAGWGIPARRIAVVRNGVSPGPAATRRDSPDGLRDRFGFFGHINRFKGAPVVLDASARLSRAGVAHSLALHGGTAFQTAPVLDAFATALAAAPDARHAGGYARADLGRLMGAVDWVVVPSIWWENAPLVIQEAFHHRRPVICADIGGMAEMVRDGTDGLHAARGDGAAFAQAMRRGIDQPGLWQRLVDGIAQPPTVAEAADAHLALYGTLRDTTTHTPHSRRAA
jgi:glycosyltransferase involved in cell wall biosynthesis